MGNIDENTPPIFVLLPSCNETDTDVFLEILKSVILHTRLHDNLHVHSLISGMAGDAFHVDMADLSVDWSKLTSHSRQIRQSKLLGFWAARHYPLIGKKLIGTAWQPPNKCNVQLSESTEITEKEVDESVSKRMQLRIIQLNVCKGTSKKLNYFIRVPMSIGRVNAAVISSKMIAFDIPGEYVKECWIALRLGQFTSNFEQQMFTDKAAQSSIVTSHVSVDQHQIVRANGDQSIAGKSNSTSTQLSDVLSSSFRVSEMPPCNVVLTNISESTGYVSCEPKTIPSAKRARNMTSNGSSTATSAIRNETNIDTLRVDISKMRNDIQHLSKCFGHNASGNDSERFHLVVFKQKDAEISKLKESLQTFEKEKELFENEKLKLYGEIEAKSDLIGALQKALDASSKLHGKMEKDSEAMIQKLADADNWKIGMTERNHSLQEELTTIQNRIADLDFQNEKQDLLQKLTDANQLNFSLSDTNVRLQEELKIAKDNAAKVESHLQVLEQKVSAADEVNVKLTEINRKIQEDLNAANNHFVDMELKLQCQIQDLFQKLTGAHQTNIELNDANDKLQKELKSMENRAADTESQYQYQMQDQVHKLSAIDQKNSELVDTNQRLQQELDAAKIELKNKEQLSEKLDNLQTRTNILIADFKVRLESIEKINAQLTGKNKDLEEQLNIWKQNAGDDKPNRSGTHIQTEGNLDNTQCIGVERDKCEKKLPESIDRTLNEGRMLEPLREQQTDRDSSQLLSEPVKSNGCTVEPKNVVQNGMKMCFWEEVFVSEDPIVQKCRPVLQQQKFGWMKFHPYKRTKFCPAFVYPADDDGLVRAQKIKADGYITDTKSPFWEYNFAWELSNDKKESSQVIALKKFNNRFGAHFD